VRSWPAPGRGHGQRRAVGAIDLPIPVIASGRVDMIFRAGGEGPLRIRVLGCYGGSAPGMRPTSFLVNERIAVDGGALTTTLSIAEQAGLTHVFLTHSHLDHLCTLPFLADNVLTLLEEPIGLYGPRIRSGVWKSISSMIGCGRTSPGFPTGKRLFFAIRCCQREKRCECPG